MDAWTWVQEMFPGIAQIYDPQTIPAQVAADNTTALNIASSDGVDIDNGEASSGLSSSTWFEIGAVLIGLFLIVALIHEVREI